LISEWGSHVTHRASGVHESNLCAVGNSVAENKLHEGENE
jgi:hypothetical protein